MEKINLFLIDMSEDGTVSGVTRYLETLLRGLASHSDIDDVTIADFESNLKGNLYKIWNRMCSGSYLPSAVKLVEIPKSN